MTNWGYLLPRLARHFLPGSLVHFLLQRSLIIKPGLETRAPKEAVERYRQVLAAQGISLQGKRVMVFGYGGNYAVGCALLQTGANHVVLVDPYSAPNHRANAALLAEYHAYLRSADGEVLPRPEYLTLLQADICKLAADAAFAPVDIVLSSSVYEHLADVDAVTKALAAVLQPGGMQVHYIDLRDHYFKYPFEMLCYTERVWRGWLNPTSNHNRCRYRDYAGIFERYFNRVEIEVLERDEAAFRKAQPRILPEFLTGDSVVDSVTLIRVTAAEPKL